MSEGWAYVGFSTPQDTRDAGMPGRRDRGWLQGLMASNARSLVAIESPSDQPLDSKRIRTLVAMGSPFDQNFVSCQGDDRMPPQTVLQTEGPGSYLSYRIISISSKLLNFLFKGNGRLIKQF